MVAAALNVPYPGARRKCEAGESAALVRGRHPFGQYQPAHVPAADSDPAVVAFHARAAAATREIVYHGAERNLGRF